VKTMIARGCMVSRTAPGALARRVSTRRRAFSLFRAFAEAPFFGFRGIVARSGSEYRVTVAAEMDMYPKYQPWVYVTPTIAERIASGRGEPIMAPLHQAAWAARDRFQRDGYPLDSGRPNM
jgi:hypothetical protein